MPAPVGRRAASQGLGGAIRQVQTEAASRENALDRVWLLCSQQSKKARAREAGDIQFSWLHAHLWQEAEQRNVPGVSADDKQEGSSEAEGDQRGTEKTNASAGAASRQMAEVCR